MDASWWRSTLPVLASLAGLAAILAWRFSETQRPVSRRSIVLPPLLMSTGFAMFALPAFQVPWPWALGAFTVGAVLLAEPLLRSSRLTRQGGHVMMRRSPAFILVVVGLAAVRYVARDYVGRVLPLAQTGAVFYLLAFGMIVRWRAWMLVEYLRLVE